MSWKTSSPPKVKRQRPEQALQRQVMQWLDFCLPPDAFAFAVPNAARRGLVDGAWMKATGMRAGVPDLVIIHRGKAVFVELKAGRGKLTVAQELMHERLTLCGAIVATFNSFDTVCEFVRSIIPTREAA